MFVCLLVEKFLYSGGAKINFEVRLRAVCITCRLTVEFRLFNWLSDWLYGSSSSFFKFINYKNVQIFKCYWAIWKKLYPVTEYATIVNCYIYFLTILVWLRVPNQNHVHTKPFFNLIMYLSKRISVSKSLKFYAF